jgi:hypothetical protein
MIQAIEKDNRRAEIYPDAVVFQKLSGNVRRSKRQVWRAEADGFLGWFMAEQWVEHCRLPRVF